MTNRNKCEVCGQPATYSVHDVYLDESMWRIDIIPDTEVHHFCAAHQRETRILGTIVSPDDFLPAQMF
jgi:hypothetical protein